MSFDEDDPMDRGEPERLDSIITDLTMDLDENDDIFSEMKNLSQYQLGNTAAEIKSAGEYFKKLKIRLEEEDTLDFLINLTDFTNYHTDFGTKQVSSSLKKYKRKLEQYQKACIRRNIYNPYFVGRKEELNLIHSELEKDGSSIRGVSICGQGGMGKTTLGNEICRRLWASPRSWQIVKMDLREKSTVTDLLKDTVLELHNRQKRKNKQENVMRYTTEEQMEKALLKQINEISGERTIVMLDNVDSIIDEAEEKFLKLIHRLLVILKDNKCKVRMIITSRQKLLWGACLKKMDKMNSELNDLMKEVEVRQLKDQHAKELIIKCTMKDQVSEKECDELAHLTECNPLAIRTVCSTLKNCCGQLKVSSMISVLKEKGKRGDIMGVEKCLEESFKRLDKKIQVCLVKLTLFKTTPFDLKAAVAVLETEGSVGEESVTLVTKMRLFHLKHRHLIEMEDRSIQAEGNLPASKPDGRNTLYSLHPLVCEFLTKRRREFPDEIQSARTAYIEYFENEIASIGKQRESNFLDTMIYLRENSAHIQGYFEAVSEISNLRFTEARSDLVRSRRIMDIATLVHDNDMQMKLLMKSGDDAWNNKKLDVWLYIQGYIIGKKIEMDKKLDIPKIIERTDAIVKQVDMEDFGPNVEGALGNYYFHKAYYFWKMEKKPETLETLTKAQRVLESGNEAVRQNFRGILAAIYNQIGCYHYEYDLEECRKYHEKAINVLSDKSKRINFPEIHTYRANLGACLYKEGSVPRLDQKSKEEKWQKATEYFRDAIDDEIEMYMDKTDDHAEKLKNICCIYLNLKQHDDALQCAEKCLKVREKIHDEPHEKITVAYGLLGRVLYHYGDQLMRDNSLVEAYKKMEDSISYFAKAMELIQNGGLTVGSEDYNRIKDCHIKVVNRVRCPRALEDVEQKYREIECPGDSSDSGESFLGFLESNSMLSSDEESMEQDSKTGAKVSPSSENNTRDLPLSVVPLKCSDEDTTGVSVSEPMAPVVPIKVPKRDHTDS